MRDPVVWLAERGFCLRYEQRFVLIEKAELISSAGSCPPECLGLMLDGVGRVDRPDDGLRRDRQSPEMPPTMRSVFFLDGVEWVWRC